LQFVVIFRYIGTSSYRDFEVPDNQVWLITLFMAQRFAPA